MTKYQTMLFQRAVKKILKEKSDNAKAKKCKSISVDLPKYITDNPFYP